MQRFSILLITALELLYLLALAEGHGMILNPIGRGSRWRKDFSVPDENRNYDDMSNYCGGFDALYNINAGKCGACGDNYADPVPRAHELGGIYGGSGVIVDTFTSGSQQEFHFKITALHQGYVYFEICNYDKFGNESEDCFSEYRLKYADGSDKLYIHALGDHRANVVLPQGLNCNHCIVRWTYYAGNSMNFCEDGVERMGCGQQETFKNCADISIA